MASWRIDPLFLPIMARHVKLPGVHKGAHRGEWLWSREAQQARARYSIYQDCFASGSRSHHASQSPAGTDKGSGEVAPPRCFFAATSPWRRPRGWGGNAPPRFSDRASAREHLRACGVAQQHHQALKRFKRIGNRSAGGTADASTQALIRPPGGRFPRLRQSLAGWEPYVEYVNITDQYSAPLGPPRVAAFSCAVLLKLLLFSLRGVLNSEPACD